MEFKIDNEFQSLIRPLKQSEIEGLEKDILEKGCLDPLKIWNGLLIDGHHRFDICTKHNIEFNTVELNTWTDRDDVKIWILNNQLQRRNLSDFERIEIEEQKKEIYLKKGRENQSHGLTAPGRTLLSDSNKSVDEETEPKKPKKKHNTQKQMAENLGISTGKVAKAEIVIAKADEETKEKLRTGDMSIDKAYRDIKKEEAKAELEQKKEQAEKEVEKILVNDRYRVYNDDFINIKLDKKLDLIITDPPYPEKFLPEWEKLGQFAKDNLKENGFLITYSGQLNLPSVLKILTEYLDYYWTVSLIHNGANQFINPRNLYCGWKPIFIFQNGFRKNKQLFDDIIQGTGRSKDFHEWQQSESEIDSLINTFSLPGETICDPFMGSGTFILDIVKLKRFAIGIEKDIVTYLKAQERIENATNKG